MTTTEPYGAKGCSCWPEEYTASHNGHAETRWYPNAGCRFHGVLAGFLADRRETGTYRVIEPDAPPPGRAGVSRPECPPGVHSMFDPCPGGCLSDEPCRKTAKIGPHSHVPNAAGDPMCVPGRYFVDTYSNPTLISKEQGVLATVRRWGRGVAELWRH